MAIIFFLIIIIIINYYFFFCAPLRVCFKPMAHCAENGTNDFVAFGQSMAATSSPLGQAPYCVLSVAECNFGKIELQYDLLVEENNKK